MALLLVEMLQHTVLAVVVLAVLETVDLDKGVVGMDSKE
jgi:hypothetical protein